MPRLSARPFLIVDRLGRRLSAPPAFVGEPAPFGRERVVEVLKLNNNPPAPTVGVVAVADRDGLVLADPSDGSILGEPALWIPRLVRARRARDTRRL